MRTRIRSTGWSACFSAGPRPRTAAQRGSGSTHGRADGRESRATLHDGASSEKKAALALLRVTGAALQRRCRAPPRQYLLVLLCCDASGLAEPDQANRGAPAAGSACHHRLCHDVLLGGQISSSGTVRAGMVLLRTRRVGVGVPAGRWALRGRGCQGLSYRLKPPRVTRRRLDNTAATGAVGVMLHTPYSDCGCLASGSASDRRHAE